MASMKDDPCVNEYRHRVRAWIEHICEKTGMDLSHIARMGKIHPSTLTRFMNDPDATHTLSGITLAKIAPATGSDFSSFDAESGEIALPPPSRYEELAMVFDAVASVYRNLDARNKHKLTETRRDKYEPAKPGACVVVNSVE